MDSNEIEQVSVEQVAQFIVSRNLATLIVFLLEAHRPIRGLAVTVLQAFGPLISPLLPRAICRKLEELLESQASIEKLLTTIEGLQEQHGH